MFSPYNAFIALTVGVCVLTLFIFLVVFVQHNTAPPLRRHRLKLHAFPAYLKEPSNTRCVAAGSVVAVPMVVDPNGISLWRLFLGDDLQPIFACLDTASPCLLVATKKCNTCTGSERHGTYSPPDHVCREPETVTHAHAHHVFRHARQDPLPGRRALAVSGRRFTCSCARVPVLGVLRSETLHVAQLRMGRTAQSG